MEKDMSTTNARHVTAVREILAGLGALRATERGRAFDAAYAHARQIRDGPLAQHIFRVVDAAWENGPEALAMFDAEPAVQAIVAAAHSAGEPTALSAPMQELARRYVAAQTRSGEALLDACAALAEARALARHGEWGVFLEATRTSEGTAKRLLDIHQQAASDPAFRAAVASNWIGATVAAELAQPSYPATAREALLSAPEPPTRTDVQAAKSATVADLVSLTPEARDANGPWFKAAKSPNHPTAHHWNIRPSVGGRYVTACGIDSVTLPTANPDAGLCSVCARHADRREIVPIPVPEPPPAPETIPTDILTRLSAHGWDVVGTPTARAGVLRYELRHAGTGEYVEIAAPEAESWLAELDLRAAWKADQRAWCQAQQDHLPAVGWRGLRFDGHEFVITKADGMEVVTADRARVERALAEAERGARPPSPRPHEEATSRAAASVAAIQHANGLGQPGGIDPAGPMAPIAPADDIEPWWKAALDAHQVIWDALAGKVEDRGVAREAAVDLLQTLAGPDALVVPPIPRDDIPLLTEQAQRAIRYLDEEGLASVAALVRMVVRYAAMESEVAA